MPAPALRQLRALRVPRIRVRKTVDLTLPPALSERAGALYRRVADVTAEAILVDLRPWLRANARADAPTRRAPYPGDLDAVLAFVRGKIDADALDRALADVARAVDDVSFRKLARVPGINPTRLLAGDARAIDRFRRTNALLIESVPKQMALDVGAVLAETDVRDLHVNEIGKILSERFSVSEARGQFWARDQTLKLYARTQETRQRAAGARQYQWETVVDERVRGRPGGRWANNASNHWVLHDTIQTWDLAPITNPNTGDRNHPGHDYQCRCSAYPLFDGADAEPLPPTDEPSQSAEEEAAELFTFEPEPAARRARRGAFVTVPTQLTSSPPAALTKRVADLADALHTDSQPDQRAALRRVVQGVLPDATTKDVTARGALYVDANKLEANSQLLAATDAEALHSWYGKITIDTAVLERAKVATRKIASGVKTIPLEETDALRVLIHEELHGHSRASLASYRGAGMVLEEVGTELQARAAVRALHAPARFGGAYQDWIDAVVSIVQGAADDRDRETSVERVRAAHAKLLRAGSKFTEPSQAVAAFVDGLDLPTAAGQYVHEALLKTFGDS